MADIGVRLVILGLAEFRRGIGTAQSDVAGFEKAIRSVSGTAAGIGTSLTNVGNSITGVGRSLSLFVTGPLLAMGAGFIRAGIQFEDAFAGVGKVVSGVSLGFDEIAAAAKDKLGITVTTMQEAEAAAQKMGMAFGDLTPLGLSLRDEFIKLGEVIPIPLNQLAELGQTVGQLGVPAEDLISTTKLLAQFATVTGMSADEAATALLHLGNILEGSSLNVEDFTRRAGSAVIALGNASVSTEPEILALATRIASAGDRAKFSEPDLLAWATAISDVGVRAELGGTAVSRAITEMLISVQTGGDGIAEFAQVSGKSIDQFKHDFQTDASGALLDFVAGLKTAFEEGTITTDMLAKMGLSGVRAIDVMGRLGNIQEILGKRLDTANEAWEKQIQIEEEFAKRTNTVQSMIQIMKNQFTELGITIFDLVKGDLQKLIESIGTIIKHFIDLDPATQKIILGFALVAAAIGPVLIIVGSLISAIGVIVTAFAGLAGAIVPITIALAAAALGFSLFGSDAVGFVQPVIDKVKELAGIILGVPKVSSIGTTGGMGPENIGANDSGRTMRESGTGDTAIPSTANLPDPTLIERIGLAFQNLKDSIVIPPEVINTFNQLKAAISTFGVVATDVFNAVVTTVQTTLGPSFTDVFNSLTETLNSFGLDWSDVWEIVKTAVVLAIEIIGGIIITLIGIVVGVLNAIASGITGFQTVFAQVSGAFQMFFDGIIREVAGFVTIFEGIFEGNIPKIIMGLSAVFTGLIEQAIGFTGIIIGIFGALISAIFGIITGFIAGALSFFGNFWAQLTGDSDNALLKIADFFTMLKDKGIQVISDMVSSIIGFFQSLFDTLIGHSIVTDMVSGIISAISGLKDDVLKLASDLVDGVIGFFGDLASKAGEILNNIFGGSEGASASTKIEIDTKAVDEAKAKIAEFQASLVTLQGVITTTGTIFATTFSSVIIAQTILTTETFNSLWLAAEAVFAATTTLLIELWNVASISFITITTNMVIVITTAFITMQSQITTVLVTIGNLFNSLATIVAVAVAKIISSLISMITTMELIAKKTMELMSIAANAVNGLAGAYRALGNAALTAASQVIAANNMIANSSTGTQDKITGSPELKIQHPFEDFESFLKKANFGDLLDSSFGNMLSVLNSVPTPVFAGAGSTQNDNSINTNITGVPVKNENDLAALIDQRVRVARGRG
jgi:TP901 family phage tail tape measure protein